MLTIADLQRLVTMANGYFPNAIIAGGAVRDIVCGVASQVRDIDIFVGTNNPEDYETEDSRFGRFCHWMASQTHSDVEFAPSNPDYGRLLDLCKLVSRGAAIPVNFAPRPWHGYDFDLVAIDVDPASDVPNYDFGLSQMFVTCESLFMTREAAQDLHDNSVTFLPLPFADAHSIIRSKKRLARLRSKYPNRLFYNCDGLDCLPEGLTGVELAAEQQTLDLVRRLSPSISREVDFHVFP